MAQQTEDILELLDLQSVDKGLFVGPPSAERRDRVFGGQVIAQALAAASFTVEARSCHSLHGYFVRPGKPGRPIEYEVAAVRDGGSFSTRQVIAVQRDEVIFQLVASFMEPGSGPEHQIPAPDAPDPDSFPSEQERLMELLRRVPEDMREEFPRKRPMEAIVIDEWDFFAEHPEPVPSLNRIWMRSRVKLADDPNLHRCALAYGSDAWVLNACMRPLGRGYRDPTLQIASLDHAMWFHRDFRADDWMLLVHDSPGVGGGRGLGRGSVYSKTGSLIASVAQEGLFRDR